MFHLGYMFVCGVMRDEYIVSFGINVALESNREVIGYRRTHMPMMALCWYVCVVRSVCDSARACGREHALPILPFLERRERADAPVLPGDFCVNRESRRFRAQRRWRPSEHCGIGMV